LAHPAPRIFKHHGHFERVESPQANPDRDEAWLPPIVRTIAIKGDGVPELVSAINDHQHHLVESGERENRDRARLQAELDILIQDNLVYRWRKSVSDAQYREILESLIARKISPHQAARDLMNGGHGT
jgi:LAO/AO transport system kinase